MPPQMAILSKTRLLPPVLRDDVLVRSRLIEHLQKHRNRALTLICAPAGSGKTTLVVQWLNAMSRRFAWLTLAPQDDSAAVFLSRVVEAIEGAFPGLMGALQQMLRADATPVMAQMTTLLVNEITELPESFLLVLEDYHLVQDPCIHEVVTQLLLQRPRQLHLVITSRTEPPIPLNALRGNGQLVEIRQSDLRFNQSEISVFVERTHELIAPTEVVQALEESTEGWAVGLRLALASVGNADELNALATNLHDAREHAVGYLTDEVLSRLDKDIQHFLVRVSILDEICAPLCTVLLDQEDETCAGVMIQAIVEANLFLTPLVFKPSESQPIRWYCFHAYFRTLLAEHLEATVPPEEINRMHMRAAWWLGTHGHVEQALRHAIAAGDTEFAANLIEENVPDAINRLDRGRINRWLNLLPNEVIEEHPGLLLRRGWAHRWSIQTALNSATLERVSMLLHNASPERRAEYQAELYGYAAQFAWEAGNSALAMEEAQKALAVRPTPPAFARGMATVYLTKSMYEEGQGEEALRYLEEEYRKHGKLFDAFSLRLSLARYRILEAQGQMELAAETASNHLFLARRGNLPTGIAWGYYMSGVCALEQWRLEAALQHFSSLEEYSWAAEPRTRLYGLLGQVLIYEWTGRRDLADARLDEAMEVAVLSGSLAAIANVRSCRARCALARGEVDRAFGLLPKPILTEVDKRPFCWIEIPELTTARVLIAEGAERSLGEARRVLDAVLEHVRRMRTTRFEIEALLVESLLCLRRERFAAAQEALHQALLLGGLRGALRSFVEMGQPLVQMLRDEMNRGVAPAFVKKVLRYLEPDESAGARTIYMTWPLTNREKDILDLLVLRYNNKEIADVLVVSPNTVRTHLVNIYEKLGARNRRDAVVKAREYGLLMG